MLPSCISYAYIVLGNQKRESHAVTMGARTQVPEEQRVLLTTEPSVCLPSSCFLKGYFHLSHFKDTHYPLEIFSLLFPSYFLSMKSHLICVSCHILLMAK